MLSKKLLSVLSLFPILGISAPSPASHQILLSSPESTVAHRNGIPQGLFNDFNDLAKLVDITHCLQTPEGLAHPFECNSFCREFPGLQLVKQWNTAATSAAADDLLVVGDSSYGYIAVSHEKGRERIVVAFAGEYSLTDAVIDLAATSEVMYTPTLAGGGRIIGSCFDCRVHGDFAREWNRTEEVIGETMRELVGRYILDKTNPYKLVLVGRKLGGAVAMLAAVDFEEMGWRPQVTTFGQPKVGNEEFIGLIAGKFTPETYRRVTHISDPVPLFPLDASGFFHYEHEYLISKEYAPYTASDVQICNANSQCSDRVDTALDLDWEAPDYFHHTDTCLREPTSLLSLFSPFLIFDIFETESSDLKKRSNFEPVLETIDEDEESEDEPAENPSCEEPWKLKQKRNIHVDPATKLVKPIPNSKFAKTFEMVEPAPPEPPPEYEDEELYHAMQYHKKAQGMWIKPHGQQRAPVTEMQKRSVTVDPEATFVKGVPDSKFKKTFSMVEAPEPEPEEEVYVPEYEDEEIYNSMSGFKKAQSMWIKPNPAEKKKEKRDIPAGAEAEELEKRGIDRALKFFHAPKEILNAQLAANDESAAYEVHRKAQQNPNDSPEAGSSSPNEDYVKKGGSVLILNGRPLEVDGRPVRNPNIQKRSNGRGPGLGLNRGNGLRRGGKRNGNNDKVTELSSSPSDTTSNSRVGVIENAIPNSFEEETVNVQKGRNFVLMNGRPMPANFAQKSVSTKPTKRSYIPGQYENGRLRFPEECRFGPEQHFGLEEHLQSLEEHWASPEQRLRRPEQHFRKPDGPGQASVGCFSNADQTLRKTESHFRPSEHFRASKEELHQPEHQPEEVHFLHSGSDFAIPEYNPEDNFYPTEDNRKFNSLYFHAPGDHFERFDFYTDHTPEEHFYTASGQQFTNEPHFEHPHEPLYFSSEANEDLVSCEHFYAPGERTHIPEDHDHIPNQREMWEIQKSLTGPVTQSWRDSRENNEVFAGEYPTETDKKKFMHNYRASVGA